MKNIIALLISGSLASAAFGADFVITSLTANGQLTWTNAITNASYRVEWAASPAGPWQQFNALTNLDAIRATSTTVTVSVPMFYRVVWADPPAPQPLGYWDFNGYSFAGTLVTTGLITLTNRLGLTEVSGTWTFGALPNGTNTWRLLCSSGEAWGGTGGNFRYSVFLGGCGFAEGAFFLDGTLLADTYSGTWYEEGYLANPVGTFIAKRKSK